MNVQKIGKILGNVAFALIAGGLVIAIVGGLALLVYEEVSEVSQDRKEVVESNAEEHVLAQLKSGDFFTVTTFDVPMCYRDVSYRRLNDTQISVLTRDSDGSLSSQLLWALGDGERLTRSCSPSDLAEYRAGQEAAAQLRQTAEQEKAYRAFFSSLKKGDLFTETEMKFGAAYCHEFIGISSSDSDSLDIAYRWQGDGSPMTDTIIGTEYSITRGCAKGSIRQ